MNLARMMNRPVGISTPGVGSVGTDGEWTDGTAVETVELGYVEQTSTQEVTDGQQTAAGTWWAALPVGTAATPTSTLTIIDTGQRFEVVGEIAARWSFRYRRNEFVRVELASVTATKATA